MMDIHCHILPGLDDGPKTMEESLSMARMALADGIAALVATPHIHPGVYDNTWSAIAVATEAFRNRLQEEGLSLEVHMAAEVRLTTALLGMLKRGEIPTYNDRSGHFLLEFPPHGIEAGSLYQIELIRRLGYRPIIAHPERNRTVRRKPAVLKPYLDLGCWLQLTAASLTGQHGRGIQDCGRELLELGWVRFIASDGHGFYHRHPVMADGVRQAAEWIGEAAVAGMVSSNPRGLLVGLG